MFVKKIPRWKIKRFIKGIIRSILFFVVLSVFSVFSICFADINGSYKSWADLVDDSKTTFTVTFSDGAVASDSASLYPSSTYPDMFYALQNSRPIDSFIFDFFGDNVLRSFKANDVFIFSGTLKLTFNEFDFDPSYISSFITFNWDFSFSNDRNGKLTSSFENFDYTFSLNQSTGKYEFVSPFKIEYTFPHDGCITSFYLSCGDLQGAQQLIIYPAQTQEGQLITYYVGSLDNAPLYQLPSDKPLTDLEDAESAVLDEYSNIQEDFFNRFDEPGTSDFGSWANNFWPANGASIGNWLAAASGLFSTIWDWLPWQMTSIIKFLLLFGMFGFILNIVSHLRRS